jgi:phosphotransferase system HPr (HPr) family protein
MISKNMIVKNENGLGARSVAVFVQIACQYDSKVFVEYDNKKVNAKSIMGMMTLSLRAGEELTVVVDGEDEEAAVKDIEEFLSSNEDR